MMMRGPSGFSHRRRATAGVLLALGAAATFGVVAPAAKGSLAHVAPIGGAGLTYLCAGAVALLAVLARRLTGMPPIGRRLTLMDAPRLAGMTLLGGIIGPALFFAGLARAAAHEAAVVQHLEFALTVVAAVLVLGERPGRRGVAGLVLVGAGVALLSFVAGNGPNHDAISAVAMALLVAACCAWAADNTLARGASGLDPLVVVSIKGLAAGIVLTLASVGIARPPGLPALGLLLLAGGVGVGLSLVLELLALRRIGAALNAGLFATGPAFGFVWSLLFLGERGGAPAWAALTLCLTGAVALAVDRHAHEHAHRPLRHAHRHHHLDGHHEHVHGSDLDPATEHVHEHGHDAVRHAHPHVHDEHHRHRH